MKYYFILFIITLLTINSAYGQKKVKKTQAHKLKTETYYVEDGKKNGSYEEVFMKVKITEGTYTDDKRIGTWNFYDYDGLLNFSGNYDDGVQDEKWTYKYNGEISSEIYYDKGEIDSVNGYHENGQLAYKLRYDTDNSGTAQSFYPDGKRKGFIPIKAGKIDGIYSLYFENGQLHREIEYKAGEKYNQLKTFDLQGNFIDGGNLYEGTGRIIIYYMPEEAETELTIHTIQNYYEGEDVGSRTYHKNGNLISENSFSEDKKMHIWKRYDEAGKFLNSGEAANLPSADSCLSKVRRRILFSDNLENMPGFLPEFQNGTAGLGLYLTKAIVYPQEALKAGIAGRVICQFVITSTGEIEDVKVVQSAGVLLDAEAVRVINTIPRYNPGFQNGVPVRVKYTLPVNFRFQ